MKLYHGTSSKFKKFDISRSGTGHGTFLGSGIYFSSNKADASQYGNIVHEVGMTICMRHIMKIIQLYGMKNRWAFSSVLPRDSCKSVVLISK